MTGIKRHLSSSQRWLGMKSRPHTFTSTLSSHKPRIVGLLLELKVMSPKRSSSSDQSQKKTRFSKLLLNLFNIFNLCNHRKHTLPMHSLKVNLLLLNFFFFFYSESTYTSWGGSQCIVHIQPIWAFCDFIQLNTTVPQPSPDHTQKL